MHHTLHATDLRHLVQISRSPLLISATDLRHLNLAVQPPMTSHRRRPLCTLLRIPDRRGTQPRAPDNRDHRVSACGQLSEANMANVERRRSKHAYVPAPVTRSVDGTFYICCRINILVVRCAQLFRTNPSRERLRRVRRSAPCPSHVLVAPARRRRGRRPAARRACPVPRPDARADRRHGISRQCSDGQASKHYRGLIRHTIGQVDCITFSRTTPSRSTVLQLIPSGARRRALCPGRRSRRCSRGQ